jgi:hypothetical protein
MNVDGFTLSAGYPLIQIFNNTSLVMNPGRISYMDEALNELNEWIEE